MRLRAAALLALAGLLAVVAASQLVPTLTRPVMVPGFVSWTKVVPVTASFSRSAVAPR